MVISRMVGAVMDPEMEGRVTKTANRVRDFFFKSHFELRSVIVAFILGIQTYPDGRVTNIPASMVNDQFGIVGLLTFIRAAETDPNLVSLALGQDLTALGLNLNSPDNLYPTFGGPWAEHPCRPQDIDFHVPPEYLINSAIRLFVICCLVFVLSVSFLGINWQHSNLIDIRMIFYFLYFTITLVIYFRLPLLLSCK